MVAFDAMRRRFRYFPLALAILVLWVTPGGAQSQVTLPEVAFKRLMNDLQITIAATPYLGDGMTIGLVVRYAASFDPSDKGGLAHLVSHLFMKATIDKNAKDIQDELNYLGATIEVQTDWDGMRFLLHGQSSKFERSLLILYQVVGEAQFNPEDLATVKKQILEEIQKPEDPRQHIRSRFEGELFRSTTYGRPLTGTKQSVENISVGDVRLFYRRYFSPNGSALVLTGNVPAPLVIQKATRIWGVWVRKDEVPFTFLPPRKPASKNVFLEDDPASPAAQFALGNLWPQRENPAFYSAVVAARILQERLTKALPTSLITVNAEGRRMTGPFYVQGQAAADQAASEIQQILEIGDAMDVSSVLQDELTDTQKKWIEEFNKSLTSTEGITQAMLDSELYRLGTNFLAAFPDLVRRVDADAVKQAAKDWIFPGGALILVRGPAAALKPALESLGPYQQINP
ncbi:MAG TPA: pitrilysin family protein [Acidobacteriota bacterium]|nr:pitrilysin family protein [Acidobacteriota bacterium]